MGTSDDPIIIRMDISRKGNVTLIFDVEVGEPRPLQAEELAKHEISLPSILDKKQMELFKLFALSSFSGSDLKVYLNLGDRVLCFLLDSTTGQLKGTC